MEQLLNIAEFVLKSFIHIWPYLLVTIPLAVVVKLSGAARYIHNVFGKNILLSVFLATIVGAFSPFCSCGVIPVISSLLISGVPLAPVMSFWIASPSMDPEIFFLSSSVLGWKLAVWRLASTFVMSLLAGYITHFLQLKGYISCDVLKTNNNSLIGHGIRSYLNSVRSVFRGKNKEVQLLAVNTSQGNKICCSLLSDFTEDNCSCYTQKAAEAQGCKESCTEEPGIGWRSVSTEIIKATIMVTKFMGFAFLITAILNLYLPEDLISWIVKANPATQVVIATIIGIPMYTSNITALPFTGGLLDLGLNKGAALAFLIAGATTTLPAMVAVWGITKKRVFILYLLYSFAGALSAGLFFNLFS